MTIKEYLLSEEIKRKKEYKGYAILSILSFVISSILLYFIISSSLFIKHPEIIAVLISAVVVLVFFLMAIDNINPIFKTPQSENFDMDIGSTVVKQETPFAEIANEMPKYKSIKFDPVSKKILLLDLKNNTHKEIYLWEYFTYFKIN